MFPLLHPSRIHRDPARGVTFTSALLSLPTEVQTRIFLLLSPDDLGILSRCVGQLEGIDQDGYLRKVWFRQTAPARVDFALFSPLRQRPDPEELVRRGTLRGVAVVSGVRSRGYWCSESAVRLSRIHAKLHDKSLRRHLSTALSPTTRPNPIVLYTQRILPSPSLLTSPSISARAHDLGKLRARDEVRRALMSGLVGQRTLGETVECGGGEGRWGGGERVMWAICPGIKEKRRYFEELARAG